jgi:hypothetical protein
VTFDPDRFAQELAAAGSRAAALAVWRRYFYVIVRLERAAREQIDRDVATRISQLPE